MEIEQESLFESLEYRESDIFKRQSIFYYTEFPEFPILDNSVGEERLREFDSSSSSIPPKTAARAYKISCT